MFTISVDNCVLNCYSYQLRVGASLGIVDTTQWKIKHRLHGCPRSATCPPWTCGCAAASSSCSSSCSSTSSSSAWCIGSRVPHQMTSSRRPRVEAQVLEYKLWNTSHLTWTRARLLWRMVRKIIGDQGLVPHFLPFARIFYVPFPYTKVLLKNCNLPEEFSLKEIFFNPCNPNSNKIFVSRKNFAFHKRSWIK